MSAQQPHNREKSHPSRYLKLAAAAVGFGVGAAMYYFYNKSSENPHTEESSSLSDDSVSFITISENTTSDTSMNDQTDNESSTESTDNSIELIGNHTESTENDTGSTENNTESAENNTELMVLAELLLDSDLNNNQSTNSIIIDNIELLLNNRDINYNESSDNTNYSIVTDLDEVIATIDTDSDFSLDSLEINPTVESPSEQSEFTMTNTDVESSTNSDVSRLNVSHESSGMLTDWDVTNSFAEVPNENPSRLSPFRLFTDESPHPGILDRLFTGNHPRPGPIHISLLSSTSTPLKRVKRKTGNSNGLSDQEYQENIRAQKFLKRSWSLEECSICFEVILLDQEMMKLPCAHNFHRDCITPWLQRRHTCPNCRQPISEA